MLQWTVWENLEEELDKGLHKVHISKIKQHQKLHRADRVSYLFSFVVSASIS